MSNKLSIQTAVIGFLLWGLFTACNSPYATHHDRVKGALQSVNYEDGISKQEAKAIADAYLVLHAKYKERPSYARIKDADEFWAGEVLIVKSLASPVDAKLPPVVIDKHTGKISWKFGPVIDRIDPDELDDHMQPASKPTTDS